MANATKVYDADQVKLTIGGFAIESGFADGEFLRVEQESEDFTDIAGTDGEVTRSKTNDRRATITVLLMQTSSGNQQLSALSNIDREGPNGVGITPLLIKDNNGDTLFTLWTNGVAVDIDPGVRATLTFPGLAAQTVVGTDVLEGFVQELITETEGGDLVIPDFLIKDYPVVLRFTD